MIVGREIGEQGTPHLQGYLEMYKVCRIAALKKFTCFARAHMEVRRGTRDEARSYCMKDGNIQEFGSWEAGGQGSRNDIRAVMKQIECGTATKAIMEAEPAVYSRNIRFLEKYERLVEKETTQAFREVDVQVYIGEPGTGKTRKATEENPGIFTVNCEDSFPFDGYNGEQAILIDDFEGTMKYHQLLRVLDGHQYRCNVKGGHRYAKWTRVIITSNKSVQSWYQRGLTGALSRRLSNVTEFGVTMCRGNTEPGNTKNEFDAMADAINSLC